MKTLNRLTIHSLKLNRKRTLVTVIGILLSTALLSAVATMVTSFQYSMIQYEKDKSGDYHYVFQHVPQEELPAIAQNRNIEQHFEAIGLGYAYLEGGVNPDKPYLYVEAMDKTGMERIGIHLTEGRLPENDGELLISKHIKTNGGVEYQVGDTVTLQVGNRISAENLEKPVTDYQADEFKEADLLTQLNPFLGEETIFPVFTKTYTVVGITERLSYGIESYTAPGYTVITYMEQNQWKNMGYMPYGVDVYTRYTREALKERIKVTAGILGLDPEVYEKYIKGMMTTDEWELWNDKIDAAYSYQENGNLIRYELLDLTDSTLEMMYGVAAVILVIIVFTSAFCIRNSFAISITEKTRQYGMLASIGATPRQIRRNVYYEAALLALVGIPFGMGCGCLASVILTQVVSALLSNILDLQLVFHVSWTSVVLSVLLAVGMIFLSAARPARKAGKVSPIVAINGAEAIKIKGSQVKAPGYIKKLFGMGGTIAYKNMKRNRKNYRVATISITVSVMIFVSLYSFMELSFRSMDYYVQEEGYNLSYRVLDMPNQYQEVSRTVGLEEVKRAAVVRYIQFYISDEDLRYTEKCLEYYPREVHGDEESIQVISLGEQEYTRYKKELGLSSDQTDQAILINNTFGYSQEEKKYYAYQLYSYQPGESIAGKIREEDDETGEPVVLTLAAVTEKRPLGFEQYYSQTGILVVSDQWMDQHIEQIRSYGTIFYDSTDADALQDTLENEFGFDSARIVNVAQSQRENQSLYLIIAIFLYGFVMVISLIGITNIFNTITTSMEVRSKEFAMLRSIGMTGKEFSHMVRMESVFYGSKALGLGLVSGIGLSYLIYYFMSKGMEIGYHLPVTGILISVIAVVLLLLVIMHVSLKKIQRKNLIETIRQENI